jgi:hypothetical protein
VFLSVLTDFQTVANECSGGHAPSYLYRIVADHYRSEDISL